MNFKQTDFTALARANVEWSNETFGPGQRTAGIVAHIRKELAEIEAAPDDLEEWVDVILLAINGYYRHGGMTGNLLDDLWRKYDKNTARKWPKPTGEDVPIEHIRGAECPRCGEGVGVHGYCQACRMMTWEGKP